MTLNEKTQNIIAKHLLGDFAKYEVSTMDAIGLLESMKLSLFNGSIKKEQKLVNGILLKTNR